MGKALVVDDSRAVRMIVGRTLEQLGYSVSQAVDGQDALAILQGATSPFEIALVDWNMPHMNGLDLVRAVRSDARFRDLTILMVTTETEAEHVMMALEAGANEYVMKPFTRDVLIEKLQLTGVTL